MEWLVDVLVGPGAAGITGLIGGMVNKFFEAKAKRQEMEFQISMRELDVQESKHERDHELAIADKQIERAQVEGEIAIGAAEMNAFETSQKVGNHKDKNSWVRPVITIYLLIAVTALFAAVWRQVGGLDSFNYDQLVILLQDMVTAAIYLTVMCVGWWFGSRPGGVFKR